MEIITIGDTIKIMYSLTVNDETIREYDDDTLIIGNKANLAGINRFVNKFIGENRDKLTGKKEILHIQPEEGYGFTDKSKIGAIPKKLMSEEVSVGDTVDLSFKDGSNIQGVVKSESDDTFIVDCNHPLVDKELVVEIKFCEFI